MRTEPWTVFSKEDEEEKSNDEEFFVVLNTIASMIVIICNVLSFQLLVGISRELKGLKTMDVM